MTLAPILLFVYNRPWHTEQTLNALMNNKLAENSTLFIYSDGPPEDSNKENINNISKVREIIKLKKWCKEVNVIERKHNFNIYKSITQGVADAVNKYGKVIVLEDDIVTSTGFLQFMNDSLTLYESDDRVMSVSGYFYPINKKFPDTFFIRGGTSAWGWGTWARAWKHYEPNANTLISRFKNKTEIRAFNYDNNYSYYNMLKSEVELPPSKWNWDIRWYASVYLSNGLGLYPGKSLVNNIGFDNTGIHCGNTKQFLNKKLVSNLIISKQSIRENLITRERISKYFKSLSKENIFHKTLRRAKKIYEKIFL